jgi:bacillithiol system protein YtxJ
MPIRPCERLDDLAPLLGGAASGFVFKHSTRCPISRRARAEVERFAAEHPEVPVLEVLVIESRPVSLAVAERTGIAHASPQALLLRAGTVAWHASHSAITADALARAWAGD